MRKIANVLFFIFLALTLISCKKEYIGDFDSNFIGEWHSESFETSTGQREIYFIINGENSEYGFMCETSCTSCNCALFTSGKAVINKKRNKLTIGSGNGKDRVNIKIKTYPYQNNSGKWVCVILTSEGNEISMYKH